MSLNGLHEKERAILSTLFERLHENIWKRRLATLLPANPSSVNYWTERLKDKGFIFPIGKSWRAPINLTKSGIIASAAAYESNQRKNEYVCKLLDEGAKMVTSSPRTAILLGAYSIAELPIEEEPSAIGIAVKSRTYVGFVGDRTASPGGRLYYKTHGHWNYNPVIAWKQHAHVRLEEYYKLAQTYVTFKEREGRNKTGSDTDSGLQVRSLVKEFPSLLVATDHPPHISLSIAGAAMPAFVAGFLVLLQSEDRLNEECITTNAGELSWEERIRVAEIAVALEKNWRTREDPHMLCSGVRPYISALGGAVCMTKRLPRKLPKTKTIETAHPSNLYHEKLDFPRGTNLPLMLIEFDGIQHEPSEKTIQNVLKKKSDLEKVLPDNVVFHDIYRTMTNMTKIAKTCFDQYEFNFEALGELMTLQHQLMMIIGASYPLADQALLRFKSSCRSVLGGKITSAGGKGAPLSVLYDPDREPKEVEEEMKRVIKPSQPSFRTLVQDVSSEEGVRIDFPSSEHWMRSKKAIAVLE